MTSGRPRAPRAMTALVVLSLAGAGKAYADGFETLVMPGEVAAAHAKHENDCGSCHKAFAKGEQNALCLDCHDDVAADLQAQRGYHGRDHEVRGAPCAQCHTEHEGRGADIVGLDREHFDHRLTDFDLHGKHAEVKCDQCHARGTPFRDAPSGCNDCHAEDDPHKGSLGAQCADCHDERSWKDAPFDHDRTRFRLLGKHAALACLDCHADRTFANAPSECDACHRKDDVHKGLNGPRCERCHTVTDWKRATFDHDRDTDFALEGAHAKLECTACHEGDPYRQRLPRECDGCHRGDDEHRGHNGERCADCHTVTSWSHITFDHDRDTRYPLRGAHRPLACEKCHVQPVYEVALKQDCYACHAADDVHAGQEGRECAQCHSEGAWKDEVIFDHDLTGFPLLGAHARTACDACHDSPTFKDAPAACNDCHADEDAHDGRLGRACERCHNPVAWTSWSFDHAADAHFALDGAHARIRCETCHDVPLEKYAVGDRSCNGCHRRDDVHRGEFGQDCGRCHTTDSFGVSGRTH